MKGKDNKCCFCLPTQAVTRYPFATSLRKIYPFVLPQPIYIYSRRNHFISTINLILHEYWYLPRSQLQSPFQNKTRTMLKKFRMNPGGVREVSINRIEVIA